MSAYRSLFAVAAAVVAPAVFAAAPKPDIENGKTIFTQQCGICHAVNKEPGAPAIGPNLAGVIGRKAGSLPDFANYSSALKAYKVIWSVKTLDDFLVNPVLKVPGTTMPMLIPDNKTRGDVVAYLATVKPLKK